MTNISNNGVSPHTNGAVFNGIINGRIPAQVKPLGGTQDKATITSEPILSLGLPEIRDRKGSLLANPIGLTPESFEKGEYRNLIESLGEIPHLRVRALGLPALAAQCFMAHKNVLAQHKHSDLLINEINVKISREQDRLAAKALTQSQSFRQQLSNAESNLAMAKKNLARTAAVVSAISNQSGAEIIAQARGTFDSHPLAAARVGVASEETKPQKFWQKLLSNIPVTIIAAVIGLLLGHSFGVLDLDSVEDNPVRALFCTLVGVAVLVPFSNALEGMSYMTAQDFQLRTHARWAHFTAMLAMVATYILLSGCVVYQGLMADSNLFAGGGALGGGATTSVASNGINNLIAFMAALLMDAGVVAFKASSGWIRGVRAANQQLRQRAIDAAKQERWNRLDGLAEFRDLLHAISDEADAGKEVARLRNEIIKAEASFLERIETLEQRRRLGDLLPREEQLAREQVHTDYMAATQKFQNELNFLIQAATQESLAGQRIVVVTPWRNKVGSFWRSVSNLFRFPGRKRIGDVEAQNEVRIYTIP